MHEHTKKTFPETNKDVFCHRCIERNQSELNAYQMPHCDIEVMCGFRFLFVKELNNKSGVSISCYLHFHTALSMLMKSPSSA